MVVAVPFDACALYGGGSYVNAWLPINMILVLACIGIVVFVYLLSRFLPGEP